MLKDSHVRLLKTHGVLIARVLMGGFFLINGINKLTGIEGTAGYIASVGLPLPLVLAWSAALLETILGAALIFGKCMAEASMLLILFVLAVSFLFHGPGLWGAEPMQQTTFMKNIAIIAGLLMIAAHAATNRNTSSTS